MKKSPDHAPNGTGAINYKSHAGKKELSKLGARAVIPYRIAYAGLMEECGGHHRGRGRNFDRNRLRLVS